MKLTQILREIYSTLKYSEIEEYIGLEVPLRITDSEKILSEIQSLVIEKFKVNIIGVKDNNVSGTIAKYGMLDITFEIKDKIEYGKNNGIQTLKYNGWVDKENPDEYKHEGIEFLQDLLDEVEEKKNYIKIFAVIEQHKKSWLKEKSYLMKQILKDQKISPLPEDEIQIFKIEDMCYTNYSGIWLWKHFYM